MCGQSSFEAGSLPLPVIAVQFRGWWFLALSLTVDDDIACFGTVNCKQMWAYQCSSNAVYHFNSLENQ